MRNRWREKAVIHEGRLVGWGWPDVNGDDFESETVLNSPEITEHNVQVGLRGRAPVQVGRNDPSTNLDGGMVAEIVGCFENDPGRIQGFVRLRLVGSFPEAFA